MKKLKSNEIRKMWKDFWKEKNHEIINSSSLIPKNDKSLLWINAGVSPLKKYFDGTVIPKSKRMANIQKCIRTNDIDNVGLTSRHHTFFEMLGNFSIGDYFKDDAIKYAFELLTNKKYFDFDKDKLYITVYDEDTYTYDLWKKLGIKEDHIIKLDTNFWEIGNGPCGPDTEIFYDRGKKYDIENIGIKLIKEDIENDRYIEIWNIVFSQYNSVDDVDRKDYLELPNKNIDTGMGLERMASILNETETNFETDLFEKTIKELENLSKIKYSGQTSFKVISDHVRTLVFALSDNAAFSNTKRGYVLRRLLRRAVVHGKKIDIKDNFMYKLVDSVIETMKIEYPILIENKERIKEELLKEEELFRKTLESGEKRLKDLFNKIKKNNGKEIKGEDSFKLYDTYGFPLELISEYAKEENLEVNKEEFNEYMKMQKERARNARGDISAMNKQNEELLNYKEESRFIGYDNYKVKTKIINLFDGEKFVDELTNSGYIILKETPFYAESGGQISDSGVIIKNGIEIDVLDVVKAPNKQHLHYVELNGVKVNKNDEIEAILNISKRNEISINHSTVHLTQFVLRKLLGKEVIQAGSKVDEKMMRFDFSYTKEIDDEKIIEIEKELNLLIKENLPVRTAVMPIEKAKEHNAIALFDEKYDDLVRVVKIGDSVELCGGTHIKYIKEIKKIAIANLESKGSNIYRIEIVINNNIEVELFKYIKPYNDEMVKLLSKIKNILKDAKSKEIKIDFNYEINNDEPKSYKDIIFNRKEMENLKIETKKLEKLYEDMKKQKALEDISYFENKITRNENFDYLICKVKNYDTKILKEIIDKIINDMNNGFVFIVNQNGYNVNFISKSNNKDFNCGEYVKNASLKSNGNGGGSLSFGQGGGTSSEFIDEIISHLQNEMIKN